MERHGFALRVIEGKMGEFRASLGKVWPYLTVFLDRHGASNFSLWSVEQMVFGYFETKTVPTYTGTERAELADWEARFGGSYEWVSTPFEEMRLVYEDFGIVRENKELIRHRVFITKLMPFAEEAYKSSHDELAAARNGKVTEGPDSNFSIWVAGGYVFGYDEIDVTMEHEMTEAEREEIVAWENRMLKLMSWLTDDIDWMLDERHENIVRIGYHN